MSHVSISAYPYDDDGCNDEKASSYYSSYSKNQLVLLVISVFLVLLSARWSY